MSTHLADCYYGEAVRGGHILDCICDRLRACRERTLDEAKAAVEALAPYERIRAQRVIKSAVAAIEALRSDGVSPSNPTP